MTAADLRIPVAGAPCGELVVSSVVVAKLAGKTARATYGVMRMQASPIRRLARVFRGELTEGVDVEPGEQGVHIGLHVAMERGVNLAQVTANLQEQVRYEVEQVGGLPVADIRVRVEDLEG